MASNLSLPLLSSVYPVFTEVSPATFRLLPIWHNWKKTTLIGLWAIQSSRSIHCFIFIDTKCHYGWVACLLHLAQSFRHFLQTLLKLTFTVWFLLQVLLCYRSSLLQVPDNRFLTIFRNELISNVKAFPWPKYVISNTNMLPVAHHSFLKCLSKPMWFTAFQLNKFIPVKLPHTWGWCSPLNTRERNHCSRAKYCSFSFILFNSLWVSLYFS